MRHILTVALFSLPLIAFGSESQKVELPKQSSGGTILESPIGSRTVEDQPLYFKWSPRQSLAKTVSLKIFRLSAQKERTLIESFDFDAKVRSMKLSHRQLPEGRYLWQIQNYNSTDPDPFSIDEAYFQIRPVYNLNLKSQRLHAAFTTGRGDYQSVDPNYKLNFDVTPTIFSGSYAGGFETTIFEVGLSYSDFTIRGELKNTQALNGHYSWRILGDNPFDFEFFLGPRLRTVFFPTIQSPDGVSLSTREETFVNIGLQLALQRQLNDKFTLVGMLGFDNSIDAEDIISDLSIEAKVRAFYNVLGPIGIAVDAAYQSDSFSKSIAGGRVAIENQVFLLTGNAILLF